MSSHLQQVDLTFECPSDWSVVATGKQVSSTVAGGKRIARFVTEKPIGRAGFNLGKFVSASSNAAR